MIIALGETIVITGATTAARELDRARSTAFGLAFLATAAMWWLYFDYVAAIAERRLEIAPDRTRWRATPTRTSTSCSSPGSSSRPSATSS